MPGRLIAAGQNGYLSDLPNGEYQLSFMGCVYPMTGDLFDDWVPLAHAILAEAEIIQRERDGS